ncbi:hypothetical protein B0H10DRAFT_2216200 [Mycena sp. CBHHK59/15]|nr:hypothetical protein B0H10DRAFT_2220866 [Mycena sp. CBHHK59/15]KAJ6620150.1 hypothetical protein B0H10DRAFT_2216200 [Mycena sp. CBHHK59/15]
MPSRTRTSSRLAANNAASGSKQASKPRPVAAAPPEPADNAVPQWDVLGTDENALVFWAPRHIDQPWAYTFEANEPVWIRNNDKWIRGKIFSRPKPEILWSDELPHWNVIYQDTYGHKLRRYFSPLRGELKPDTPVVHELLRAANWIQ